MDIETRRAIYHLLSLWEQYSSTTGKDGHVYYLHQCMAAGGNAAAYLMRLGLGEDDGIGCSLNEKGRAIALDNSLNED